MNKTSVASIFNADAALARSIPPMRAATESVALNDMLLPDQIQVMLGIMMRSAIGIAGAFRMVELGIHSEEHRQRLRLLVLKEMVEKLTWAFDKGVEEATQTDSIDKARAAIAKARS